MSVPFLFHSSPGPQPHEKEATTYRMHAGQLQEQDALCRAQEDTA